MPARRSSGRGLDPTEELVRLLALQIRLQLGNQSQAIIEMDRAGLGAGRIAELLGTTPNTVNVALNRAKRGARTSGR
jgi:DNA-directed RNA polymerase specialized sigma24 family protein